MTLASFRGTVNSVAQRTACDRRYVPASRKGVIALYGSTGTRDSFFALDAVSRELRDITDLDFPVASCDTGVLWGNSTMLARITQLRTNAQGTDPVPTQFASGKVHLLGISSGGVAALAWAKANPSLVQSISLLIPALDIQAIDSENRSGFSAEIQTAYGGAPADADNPADFAGDLTSIPIKVWYSTTDAVTTESESLAFIAASGARGQSMGQVGHFWGPPWSGRDVALWMKSQD